MQCVREPVWGCAGGYGKMKGRERQGEARKERRAGEGGGTAQVRVRKNGAMRLLTGNVKRVRKGERAREGDRE